MSAPTIPLGEVTDILSGFAFNSKYFNKTKGIPIIRIRDVTRGYSDTRYDGPFDPDYLVSDGDMLIGMDGEFNIAPWSGGKALLNQRVCKISAKDTSKLNERYLLHFLPKQLKLIEYKTPFVTVKHLSVKGIRAIKLPLLPLATQQRIADTLDTADALRRKDQEMLGKYDELAHSLFDGIFGDPVRNEKGWDAHKLGDVSSVQIGPFGSLLHVHDYVQGGIPLVNPTHINNGLITEDDDYTVSSAKHASLRNYHLETGDVIMGRRGEMGRCALVTERENGWLCGTGSLVVRPYKNMDSSLLVKILSHPSTKLELEKSSMGTTMMNLNQKIVSNIKVIMPPVSEQVRFEQALKSLNRQREQVKMNIQESSTLFDSLLHSYFS